MTNDYGFSNEIGSSRSCPSTLTVLNYPKSRYIFDHQYLLLKLGSIAHSDRDLVAVFGWETGIDFPFRGLTFIHPFQYNVQYKKTLCTWLVHPLAALIDLKRTLAGKKLETSEAM